METRLMKWGNSQGIRLPKAILEEAHLSLGHRLEVHVKEGAIILSPAKAKTELQTLLEGITPENLHGETSTGPAVGQEIW